jgi:uncharacterized membrane protein
VTRNRALLIGLVLGLATIALSAWAYPALPDRVPTHWDMAGHPNGYSSRFFAVSLMPGIVAFTWLLMLVLPAISPRGFRLEASAGAFYGSVLAIMAVLLVLHYLILRAELGQSAPPNALLLGPIGVLLAVLGAFMGRLKKNFFIGIRTPWTLASDEVWSRSNRLGGRLFVLGGIVVVVASFFGSAAIPTLLAVIAVAAVVPIAYSYILYRRIEGFGPESSAE